MAHIRKPLGAAVVLNTAVFVVEAIAGVWANSASLIMDAVHNFSDELALICLFLAYCMAVRVLKNLQRFANLFNSIGLAAAAGNWGVARVLRPWQAQNAAIRLAYLHNLGDVYISLLPALAGVLVSISGLSLFDPVLAAVVAVWIIASTVQEFRRSGEALLWPENVTCAHVAMSDVGAVR